MTDKAKGKSYTTATGARQWTRDTRPKGESAKALSAASDRILDDLVKLSAKEFKKKHGVTYKEASSRLSAAGWAKASEHIKEIVGKSDTTTELYDKFEKKYAKSEKKAKAGYAKGGYVNCGASVKPNGKSKK